MTWKIDNQHYKLWIQDQQITKGLEKHDSDKIFLKDQTSFKFLVSTKSIVTCAQRCQVYGFGIKSKDF